MSLTAISTGRQAARPRTTTTATGGLAKTLSTELGDVEIEIPRDRKGSFKPRLVEKRQRHLAGLDDRIIGMYAGSMSVREISRHLSDLHGTTIGKDQVSRITDRVLEDVEALRHRPSEAIYPIVYLDALTVKAPPTLRSADVPAISQLGLP